MTLSPDRRAPRGEAFIIPSGKEPIPEDGLKPSGEWKPAPKVIANTLVTLETHRPGKAPSVIKYVYVTVENIKKEDLPPEIIDALPRSIIVILSLESSDSRLQEIAEGLFGREREDRVKLGGDVEAIIKDITHFIEADN